MIIGMIDICILVHYIIAHYSQEDIITVIICLIHIIGVAHIEHIGLVTNHICKFDLINNFKLTFFKKNFLIIKKLNKINNYNFFFC